MDPMHGAFFPADEPPLESLLPLPDVASVSRDKSWTRGSQLFSMARLSPGKRILALLPLSVFLQRTQPGLGPAVLQLC